jgi:putative sigma-54 modulation protein
MQKTIQFVHTDTKKELHDLTIDKLDHLAEKFDWIIRGDVFFKEEKDTNRGLGKICEIRLSVPGPRIFAKANKESFEAALAETLNELERQLKKHKSKMYNS